MRFSNKREKKYLKKKILLSKESDKVASIFEKNQASKEELIKQFKFEEDKIESIVKESSASYSSANDMQFFSDDFAKVKAKKEQLGNKISKYDEEITKMKEKYETLLSQQKQNKNREQKYDNDAYIESLIKKKEEILDQDKSLVNMFEEYEKKIDKLTNTKNKLRKKIEDLEWEECFQENL